MNGRSITVKGVGNVSAKPDVIVISIEQKTHALEYDKTMEKAAADLGEIRKAIAGAGHDPVELKTSDFSVNTHYENEKDSHGDYKGRFKGYVCSHSLNFEFGYDIKELGRILSALANCKAKPEFSINFSIKDKDVIKERMLENAVANAVNKVGVLAKAAGVKLGEILRIDYNWGELNVYSRTRFVGCVAGTTASYVDIEPEDVEASDTVTVVWAIEE